MCKHQNVKNNNLQTYSTGEHVPNYFLAVISNFLESGSCLEPKKEEKEEKEKGVRLMC